MWLDVDPGTGTQKRHVLIKDWIECSKHVDQSRLKFQHASRGLYDHVMTSRILTLIVNEIIM